MMFNKVALIGLSSQYAGYLSILLMTALLSGGVEAQGERVAPRIEPLMRSPAAPLWPDGQVPICFNGRDNSREAAWVKDALQHTWASVAQIDFHYSDSCPPASSTNYIQIDWFAEPGWGIGGTSGSGVGSPTVARLGYCTGSNCDPVEYEEAFKAVAAHELGHAIGFAHEHQRDDRAPPPNCIRPEPQRSDYATDPDYKAAHSAWVANYAVITGGVKLSEAYDPDSIMNYCRGLSATNAVPLVYRRDYQAADRLSVGDLYGAQQAYGIRMPYWLISPAP